MTTLTYKHMDADAAHHFISALEAQQKLLCEYTELPINEHDAVFIATVRLQEAIELLKKFK